MFYEDLCRAATVVSHELEDIPCRGDYPHCVTNKKRLKAVFPASDDPFRPLSISHAAVMFLAQLPFHAEFLQK